MLTDSELDDLINEKIGEKRGCYYQCKQNHEQGCTYDGSSGNDDSTGDNGLDESCVERAGQGAARSHRDNSATIAPGDGGNEEEIKDDDGERGKIICGHTPSQSRYQPLRRSRW